MALCSDIRSVHPSLFQISLSISPFVSLSLPLTRISTSTNSIDSESTQCHMRIHFFIHPRIRFLAAQTSRLTAIRLIIFAAPFIALAHTIDDVVAVTVVVVAVVVAIFHLTQWKPDIELSIRFCPFRTMIHRVHRDTRIENGTKHEFIQSFRNGKSQWKPYLAIVEFAPAKIVPKKFSFFFSGHTLVRTQNAHIRTSSAFAREWGPFAKGWNICCSSANADYEREYDEYSAYAYAFPLFVCVCVYGSASLSVILSLRFS